MNEGVEQNMYGVWISIIVAIFILHSRYMKSAKWYSV